MVRTLVAGSAGGLAAELTGGKFENGFLTAATAHLFNHELTKQITRQSIIHKNRHRRFDTVQQVPNVDTLVTGFGFNTTVLGGIDVAIGVMIESTGKRRGFLSIGPSGGFNLSGDAFAGVFIGKSIENLAGFSFFVTGTASEVTGTAFFASNLDLIGGTAGAGLGIPVPQVAVGFSFTFITSEPPQMQPLGLDVP